MTIYFDQTQALLASAKHGRIGTRAFRELLPGLSQQIERDRFSGAIEAWGQSLNFDENACESITDAKLLSVVGRIAQAKIRSGAAYHAGLLHTYGYLLSNIQTPYGYKHERWTDGLLDAGFGFPKRTFWPTDDQGTLLGNVTFFILSTLKATRSTSAYEPETQNVSAPIHWYDYGALEIEGLNESFQIGKKRVALFSRFVRLPKRRSRYLLIYSLQVNDGKELLLTCFPIAKEIRNGFFEAPRIGSKVAVELRFNAFLENGIGRTFQGSRAIEDG